MKKIVLLLIISVIPLLASAQQEKQTYYIYNIVNFEGKLKNEGFKVTVDDGRTIEKLRDEKGKRIEFTTPAGALIYFTSKGWELYSHGSTMHTTEYGFAGEDLTNSYWILRKPCTKEEFEEAVKNSIKK